MKSSLRKLFVFAMALAVVGVVGAATETEPGEKGLVPAADASAPVELDPFYGASDITSATVGVPQCVCGIGINCCGDLPFNRCSSGGRCVCTADGCVNDGGRPRPFPRPRPRPVPQP